MTTSLAHDEAYYRLCAQKIVAAIPLSVYFTCGEPLIVWNKVKTAIQCLLDAGICVSINTNATLVTEEIAAFLAENSIDAFVSFPCSRPEVFDGIVNCSGAYERALNGIKRLIAAGVRVSLNMVVTKLNFPYIYETAEFVCHNLKLSYFSATKASFPNNASSEFRNQMLSLDEFNDMLNILMKVKRDFGIRIDSAWVYSLCGFACKDTMEQFGFNRKCSCGKYSFVLDADGNMKACGCDSQSFGNIAEDTFATAIGKMTQWQDGSMLPPECKACSALKYCGGGCRSEAFSAYGSHCALDSTANPHDFILSGLEGSEPQEDTLDMVFSCPGKVRFVEENGFVRVSYRSNYEFVTREAAMFLQNNPCFTGKQLCEVTLSTKSAVQQWLKKMCSKTLLVCCSEQEPGVCVVPESRFWLSATPYVEEGIPQYVIDYANADHNSKRYM